MLRILILCLCCVSALGFAQEQNETPQELLKKAEELAKKQKEQTQAAIDAAKKKNKAEFSVPTQAQLEEQQRLISEGLQEAETLSTQKDFLNMIETEQGKLRALSTSGEGAGFVLPDYVEQERTGRYLEDALNASSEIEQQTGAINQATYPIVLVSLSMPVEQIQNLIEEAYHIGAGIAVRGLIDDDFETTVNRLREIAGEYSGGLMIDPTLFRRFNVNTVPTFILPIDPIVPCTNDGCPPSRHVKASGSATFDFFLRMVSRVGTDEEKAVASKYIKSKGDSY